MIGKLRLLTFGAVTLGVLSVLLLSAARPAQAQTETVVHQFTSSPDGATPFAPLISDGVGNFYSTTAYGGAHNGGTVFELTPISNGGFKETVLYSFCSAGGGNCTDGKRPGAQLMFDSRGNLYGTTTEGGTYRQGTVYKLSRVGRSWTETVLFSFCSEGWPNCPNGAFPISGLVMDAAGNLYGTTQFGGDQNTGTVFELSPSGTERAISSINAWGAGLTMDAYGNIFGAEISKVFELSPNGNGGWNYYLIYNFRPHSGDLYDVLIDGTLALDDAGNLYGTTANGGDYDYGSVYKLSSGENGRWTYTLLYSFDFQDGFGPVGVVLDAAGNIYGTTVEGGQFGAGTVFELERTKLAMAATKQRLSGISTTRAEPCRMTARFWTESETSMVQPSTADTSDMALCSK